MPYYKFKYYGLINFVTTNVDTSIFDVRKIDTDIAYHSNASWGGTNNNIYFISGQGLPGNLFELNTVFHDGNSLKVELENVYRFGSHAVNLEISPDGRYFALQGRELFKTIDTLNENGIFIFDTEQNKLKKYHLSNGNCPGEDCYEWPVWLNEKELIYSRWYKNSIDLYNIETGKNRTLYMSEHTEQHTSIAHLSSSLDGNYVAFIEWSYDIGDYKLNILNINTGTVQTIKTLNSISGTFYGQPIFEIAWSNNSENLYYAYTDMESNTLKIFNIQKSGQAETLVWKKENAMPVGLDLNSDGDKLILTTSKDVNNDKVYQLTVEHK